MNSPRGRRNSGSFQQGAVEAAQRKEHNAEVVRQEAVAWQGQAREVSALAFVSGTAAFGSSRETSKAARIVQREFHQGSSGATKGVHQAYPPKPSNRHVHKRYSNRHVHATRANRGNSSARNVRRAKRKCRGTPVWRRMSGGRGKETWRGRSPTQFNKVCRVRTRRNARTCQIQVT